MGEATLGKLNPTTMDLAATLEWQNMTMVLVERMGGQDDSLLYF
jgi:hypothetical protein